MKAMKITAVRQNIYEVVEEVVKENFPVKILAKTGNAVMLSEDDYSAILETLYLSSIPGMREKLLSGKQEDIKDSLEKSSISWLTE